MNKSRRRVFNMTQLLDDKVAIVTGGSSGIGRACALAFVREGAKVVIADVDVEGGEETVHIIREAGGESIFVKTDVTKATEVEAMVNKAVETYGRLDCGFNNAGVGPVYCLTADYKEEDWDRIISINLKGVWLCMKYEIRQMLKQGKGAITNTASAVGLVGIENRPAYVASKHGVVGLTKVAALDYATAGIRINAVCPGYIRTPMLEHVWESDPEAEKVATARHPIGRVGAPGEVAEAVVWLSSDAASFVTGHSLAVDGGWVSR